MSNQIENIKKNGLNIFMLPLFSWEEKQSEGGGGALTVNASSSNHTWGLGSILDRFLKLSAAEITFNRGRGIKATLLDVQNFIDRDCGSVLRQAHREHQHFGKGT